MKNMNDDKNKIDSTGNDSGGQRLYLKSGLISMNQSDYELPVYLVGLGVDMDRIKPRPEGFMQYQFFFIESGTSIFTCGNSTYRFAPRTCVFIPPYIPYVNEVTQKPFKFLWISFNGLTISDTLKHFSLKDVCVFSAGNFNRFTSIFYDIFYLSGRTYDSAFFSKSVYELIIEFSKQIVTSNISSDYLFEMKRIYDYIEEHYYEYISLNILAEKFNLKNKYQICRLYPKIFKMTFHEHIVRAKLQRAKVILTTTTKSISEIASELDFCDETYFGKVFNKHEHMSPSEYRRQFGHNF